MFLLIMMVKVSDRMSAFPSYKNIRTKSFFLVFDKLNYFEDDWKQLNALQKCVSDWFERMWEMIRQNSLNQHYFNVLCPNDAVSVIIYFKASDKRNNQHADKPFIKKGNVYEITRQNFTWILILRAVGDFNNEQENTVTLK